MKKLIVANWKMNPQTYAEAEDLLKKIISDTKNVESEIVICPPFTWLTDFSHKNESHILFGAQNVFYEEKGTYTGEISPLMLKNSNVQYVIIGHSERRTLLGETDAMVNKKIKKALEVGLKVIFCIGETIEERNNGNTEAVLAGQIKEGLTGIESLNYVSIAYEPLWAISTGDPYATKELPTAEKVERVFSYIKKVLEDLYSEKEVSQVRIIYGGSANGQNAKEYLQDAGADGLLVGGASLKPDEFVKIINAGNT